MSTLGLIHVVFCAVAIVAGAVVLLLPKGTRWHRTVGHVYVSGMIGVIVTALSIYRMTGSFGPFHIAALISAVSVAGGMAPVLLRRPRGEWLEVHAKVMSWSYVGLMAAFAAESLSRFVMPRVQPFLEGNSLWGAFWAAVGLATFAVVGVGKLLIVRKLPGAIASTPEAMRRERMRLRESVGRTPGAGGSDVAGEAVEGASRVEGASTVGAASGAEA